MCSKHFKEEDFDRSLSKVRLHSGTIPSIFEAFPHHLKLKETPKRKPPKERQLGYPVPSPGCASEHFEIVPEGDVDNEEYTYIPSTRHLSLCSNSTVAYIAGFVVYKRKKSLKYETCIDALIGSDSDPIHSLIRLKSKGHLIHPSDDVIEISLGCEKMFRESIGLSKSNNADLSLGRNKLNKKMLSR